MPKDKPKKSRAEIRARKQWEKSPTKRLHPWGGSEHTPIIKPPHLPPGTNVV